MRRIILPCVALLTCGGCFDPGSAVDDGMVADTDAEEEEDIDFVDELDADRGDWTFADEPGAEQEGPGEWAYRGGDLVQLSDISGPDEAVPSRGTVALGGDVDWDAYSVETAFTADDDGVVGVVCHASSGTTYTRLSLDHETGIMRIVRRAGDTFTLLAEATALPAPVPLEVERGLRLDCGATYRGLLDDRVVLETAGDPEAEGQAGMYASSIGDGPNGLRFHFIEVD